MWVRGYCCFNSKIVGPAAGSASVDSKGETRAAGKGTKIKTRCRFDMVVNVLPHVWVL